MVQEMQAIGSGTWRRSRRSSGNAEDVVRGAQGGEEVVETNSDSGSDSDDSDTAYGTFGATFGTGDIICVPF